MSAYGMKPKFTNWQGYQKWLGEWRILYSHLAVTCRSRKHEIKQAKRDGCYNEVKRLQEKYRYEQVMATKMLTLRNEAVIRWHNLKAMMLGIKAQYSEFPLDVCDAKNIDFHFNKKHLEFPQIPPWVLKAKGRTYYIHHLDCTLSWSTRERPDDSSTKGMIRIKKGNIHIDYFGNATIH